MFRIEFPQIFNFTYLKELVEDFPSENPCEVVADNSTHYIPQGNFTCVFLQSSDLSYHTIEWHGNGASIPKSSDIWLRLKNVYNPPYEMITDFFKINVLLSNTNFTYELDNHVGGLNITTGPLADTALNPVLNVPISSSTTYDFILEFLPTNAFQSIRIITKFATITLCEIINGLTPTSIITPITCTRQVNVLDISGFTEYSRKYKLSYDTVKVYLRGTIPATAGTLPPFEIYTYKQANWLEKVDQNVTSINTAISIQASPGAQTLTTFTDGDGVSPILADPGNS